MSRKISQKTKKRLVYDLCFGAKVGDGDLSDAVADEMDAIARKAVKDGEAAMAIAQKNNHLS